MSNTIQGTKKNLSLSNFSWLFVIFLCNLLRWCDLTFLLWRIALCNVYICRPSLPCHQFLLFQFYYYVFIWLLHIFSAVLYHTTFFLFYFSPLKIFLSLLFTCYCYLLLLILVFNFSKYFIWICLLAGQYSEALESAIELQEKVESVMGKDCAIYASCLNNVALMHKLVSLYLCVCVCVCVCVYSMCVQYACVW